MGHSVHSISVTYQIVTVTNRSCMHCTFRVTIQLVQNLALTSNFSFDVNVRFGSTLCVILYVCTHNGTTHM